MTQQLTITDIDKSVQDKVTRQAQEKKTIDGVTIIDLKTFLSEDGTFTELLRFNNGTVPAFPGFSVAQINRSIMLPSTTKAWHLHFGQDEVWSVGPTTHLLLGLWDVRENSPTKGVSMRIPITHNRLVYIPRGVAHGAANHSTHHGEVIYFVSNWYNKEDPDEQRLPWDSLGSAFWEMKKE
jgi:dTDP-4-dehydrorhamnose 3,5-epimerase